MTLRRTRSTCCRGFTNRSCAPFSPSVASCAECQVEFMVWPEAWLEGPRSQSIFDVSYGYIGLSTRLPGETMRGKLPAGRYHGTGIGRMAIMDKWKSVSI
jgi:hypothetical protein